MVDEKKDLILPKDPYLPFTRDQNPAPVSLAGQQGIRTIRDPGKSSKVDDQPKTR